MVRRGRVQDGALTPESGPGGAPAPVSLVPLSQDDCSLCGTPGKPWPNELECCSRCGAVRPAAIWRLETWAPDDDMRDIRGYYSDPHDAVAAAKRYREADGWSTTITVLDLTDAQERDDLCSRLNRGLS